jgi:hypothetical protein
MAPQLAQKKLFKMESILDGDFKCIHPSVLSFCHLQSYNLQLWNYYRRLYFYKFSDSMSISSEFEFVLEPSQINVFLLYFIIFFITYSCFNFLVKLNWNTSFCMSFFPTLLYWLTICTINLV